MESKNNFFFFFQTRNLFVIGCFSLFKGFISQIQGRAILERNLRFSYGSLQFLLFRVFCWYNGLLEALLRQEVKPNSNGFNKCLNFCVFD